MARSFLIEVLGWVGVLLLCGASAIAAPDTLMGMGHDRGWQFTAIFVALIWAASLSITSPTRFGIAVVIGLIAGWLAVEWLIATVGLKESYLRLWLPDVESGMLERLPATVYELGAFLAAALLLLPGILTSRGLPFSGRTISTALVIWLGGFFLVAIAIWASPLPVSLSSLSVMLETYFGPVLASAVAVIGWNLFLHFRPTNSGTA